MLTAVLTAALTIAQLQTTTIPVGSPSVPPQAAPPTQDSDDSPEEIAKDAQRDLKDSRFYNRPGATRDQYNHDWQECRLIARGSTTPSGTVTMVYNPAVTSPIVASVGAGIGAMIAQAIIDGQMRRANRKQCLFIRGWRLVEPNPTEVARVQALTDADRDAYFNTIVGAQDLAQAKVTSWDNDFAAPKLAPEAEQ